jgi:hypothetical protein
MSQRSLEAALGRLICDDAFRREFYGDAKVAVMRAGFELTTVEIGSLRRIASDTVENLARQVDDRVRRAEVPRSSSS